MNARYNAVIIGQTGVGKSSLINYLYGEKIAKTGVGKPVTTNGFHEYDFELNGLPVRLFDSWGLEVGKDEQWMNDLNQEFQKRGVTESADKWFHSAFYCISASSARIQDFDTKIIRKFIEEKYKISVVLTKCDQISEDVEDDLKRELQSQIKGLSIISVCSEEKTTRMGTSKPFGKEDVERQAFNDFFDSLILRLPLRCKSVMEQELKDWVNDARKKTIKYRDVISAAEYVVKIEIESIAKKLPAKMNEVANFEIKKTFEMYGAFAAHLGYPPSEFDNSKNHNLDSIKPEEDDWWEMPVGVVLSVIPFVGDFFKDLAIENIEKYISKCETEFKKIIDKQVEDTTKMLESLKLKVIEQQKKSN